MAQNGSNREMPIANDKFLRKIAKSTESHFVREGYPESRADCSKVYAVES
ncbi:MAG: hypothetical protein V2I31_08905 [Mariniphaga sp.]|nr:hypothetical protein [Mariniphaga sp.]